VHVRGVREGGGGRGGAARVLSRAVHPAAAEISAWIAGWARRSPDAVALRLEDDEIGYGALERRVALLAGALVDRVGLREGERIAYLGANAPELLDLLFACARTGAIMVPLSARMPAPELEVVLQNTEPAALLVELELAGTAHEAGDGRGLRVISLESLAEILDGARELFHDPGRDPRAPLLVINTSGTTGPTKGAVITSEMLHFNALNVRAAIGVAPGDEVRTNGPLFNTGPLNILTTPALAAGATVTLQREFEPGAMLAEIERRHARRGAGRVRRAAHARRVERGRRQGALRRRARLLQAPARRDLHRRAATQRDRQGPGRRAAPVAAQAGLGQAASAIGRSGATAPPQSKRSSSTACPLRRASTMMPHGLGCTMTSARGWRRRSRTISRVCSRVSSWGMHRVSAEARGKDMRDSRRRTCG
jgi:acyl-CoA synthetase (AMP-forming)/AMP-acid ligase II